MADENETLEEEVLDEESGQGEEHGARELDFILDIPLELSVEAGQNQDAGQ